MLNISLNSNAEDLLAEPSRYKAHGELNAFCNSIQCNKVKNKNGSYGSIGRILNVSKYTDDCPDCGCAILWLRTSEIYKKGIKEGSRVHGD